MPRPSMSVAAAAVAEVAAVESRDPTAQALAHDPPSDAGGPVGGEAEVLPD